MRKIVALGLVAAAGVSLAGCSTVSTEPDQVALWYSGGSFSSKAFKGCVPTSTREVHGPGERYFNYPTSQRTFLASNSEGAEAGPIGIVSKDNTEMIAPVSVTLTLNTDCTPITVDGVEYKGGMLQYFHEKWGNRNTAYWNTDTEGDSEAVDSAPLGWVRTLQFGVGIPLDQAYDRTAQGYNWRDLWNNPATKTAVEKDLIATLQSRVDSQMQAPPGEHFFTIDQITILKPDVTNPDLKKAVADEQASVSAAQSAKAKAEAQEAAAKAQIAVAQAEAAQYKAQADALGDLWIYKYAIDHNISPWQTVNGSSVLPQSTK